MRGAAFAAAMAAMFAGCQRPGGVSSEAPRFAVLTTSMGEIKLRLLTGQAPETTANFFALATGKKAWRDPVTGKTRAEPIYDGALFHRVVPGEFVQTGDPSGLGRGDVGFTIPDELSAGLKFDRPGRVAMANFGPGTGASQFFITLSPRPELDGRYTIFADVVAGLDVADKISRVPRDESSGSDRPLDPPVLRSVRFSEN